MIFFEIQKIRVSIKSQIQGQHFNLLATSKLFIKISENEEGLLSPSTLSLLHIMYPFLGGPC